MTYRVRLTRSAADDLDRLYDFQLQRDLRAAERALAALEQAFAMLREFPFSCRKADPANPFLRELIVPFGSAGYVALFEIEDQSTVTVLAVRHQLEDDYH